jgi:hypothetical protein
MAEKELVVISSDVSPMLFKIKYAGGGQLPEMLSGQYTSFHNAKSAIQHYLLTRKPSKRKANGTSKS